MARITSTASGSIASFNSPGKVPINSLKVNMLPKQEGTGDPAPDNVRPITGWTGVTAYRTGKNIFNINAPQANPSDTSASNSVKRIFTPGTYCVGISANNYWNPSNVTNYNIENNTISITVEGTYGIGYALPLVPGNYRISCDGTNQRINMGYYSADGTFINYQNSVINASSSTTDNDFTVPAGCAITIVVFMGATLSTLATFSNVQIKYGSSKSQYEPHAGLNIPVTFPALGKNLFDSDLNEWETGTVYSYYKLPSSNETYILSFVDKDTSVNISDISFGFSYEFPSDGSVAGRGYNWVVEYNRIASDRTNTVTHGSDSSLMGEKCQYLMVYPKNALSRLLERYDIQLELGSTSTSYEPYTNTVYGGYVDLVTGELVAEWQKVVVTQSSALYSGNGYDGTMGTNRLVFVPETGVGGPTTSRGYCDKLKLYKSSTWDNPNNCIWGFCLNVYEQLHIVFDNETVGITEELTSSERNTLIKEWLATNNLSFILPLKTPITYQLTPQQLATFKGVNNIWSDAENVEVNYDYAESVDIFKLRQQMMANHIVDPDGWQYKAFIPQSNTTNGSTTISAIQAELPKRYRYAVALKHNPSDPYNNAFLGAIFLPTREDIHTLRFRDGGYVALPNGKSSSYDLVLNSGEKVDIFWRYKPLGDDVPQTTWDYSSILPGPITRADALKTALTTGPSWSSKLAVADLDFKKVPSDVNRTYCESITIDSSNMTGQYIRTNDLSYQATSSWTNAYDCQIAELMPIMSFSFQSIGAFTKSYCVQRRPDANNSFVINHNLGIMPRFCMIKIVESTRVRTDAYIAWSMTDFNVVGMNSASDPKNGAAYFRFFYSNNWTYTWRALPSEYVLYDENIINFVGYPYGTSRSQWDKDADYIVEVWG